MKKQILAPSILALFVASAAHAGATFDTAAGSLYLGGDVEFDFTTESNKTVEAAGSEYTYEEYDNFDAGGRLLIDIHGEHALDNGNFAAFKVNPLYKQNGDTALDDAWFQFGTKANWNIKVGHFEAADLSVAGQDTYIAEAGVVDMYRANEGRGRTGGDNDPAQVTFTKTLTDATAFEVTAQSQDSGRYVIARPVVTYAADSVSLAVGAEVPVVDTEDAYDWVGFGATTTVTLSDDLAVNARVAYKTGDDAVAISFDGLSGRFEGDAMTVGLGAQYQNLYVAVLYGENDIDEAGVDAEADETQIYASYKIPAVMDIDNFDIYLAAGYAMSDGELNGVDGDVDDVVGARIRLKYIF